MISKRFIGFMFPIITLNIGMSFSYFLPKIKNNAGYIFKNVIVKLYIAWLLILIISWFFNNELSLLIFGSPNFYNLITPLIVLLIINSSINVISGYYRGIQNYKLMNSINVSFWFFTLISVVVLYFSNNYNNLIKYFYCISAITSILLIYSIFKIFQFSSNSQEFDYREFYHFGFKRLLTGFSLAGMFYFPIFFSTHLNGLESAALIGILLTFLRLSQIIINPFNILFLPEFKAIIGDISKEELKSKIQILINFCSIIFFLGISFYIISNDLVLIWFGEKYKDVNNYLLYFIPGITSYMIYVFLRSPIDVLFKETKSNYITFSGLLLFFLITIIGLKYNLEINIAIVYSITLSFLFLGLCSLIIIFKKFKTSFFQKGFLKICSFLILYMILGILIKNINYSIDFIFVFFFKIFLIILFLIGLYIVAKNTEYNFLKIKELISH